MSRLLRTPQANADLDVIWLYIARENINAADRIIDQISSRCNQLASAPLTGQHCTGLPPYLPSDLRQSVVGMFVLFYRPMEDGIELYRVLHGARDIPDVFRRESLE